MIFIQSSLPSPDIGPDLPEKDKLLHLAAYGVMGYLACRAFATLPRLRLPLMIAMAGFVFALLFGASDEWHQSFVPGRTCDGWDLVADGVGALLAVAAFSWRRHRTGTGGSTFPR